MNGEVCGTCAATMPPQIIGPLAQSAFEELTHLGVLIRDRIGGEWADVYTEFEAQYFSMIEKHEPERFAR